MVVKVLFLFFMYFFIYERWVWRYTCSEATVMAMKMVKCMKVIMVGLVMNFVNCLREFILCLLVLWLLLIKLSGLSSSAS